MTMTEIASLKAELAAAREERDEAERLRKCEVAARDDQWERRKRAEATLTAERASSEGLREALEGLRQAVIANAAQILWTERMCDALTRAALSAAPPNAPPQEDLGALRAAGPRRPRRGSLDDFAEHFKSALAMAVRNGIPFPFGVALLCADAATKRAARQRPQKKSQKPSEQKP